VTAASPGEQGELADALRIVKGLDEYAADEKHRKFMGHTDWIPIDLKVWKILSASLRRPASPAIPEDK